MPVFPHPARDEKVAKLVKLSRENSSEMLDRLHGAIRRTANHNAKERVTDNS
jgi:hypothetical protein